MKKIFLICFILLIFPTYIFSQNKINDNLTTPEGTMGAYYKAFELSDFELQKNTLADSIKSVGELRYNKISPILINHEILNIREVKEKEYSFHQDGDVDILVKENYKNNKKNIVSFILRRFENNWRIIDFVTENKAEEPIDEKEVGGEKEVYNRKLK